MTDDGDESTSSSRFRRMYKGAKRMNLFNSRSGGVKSNNYSNSSSGGGGGGGGGGNVINERLQPNLTENIQNIARPTQSIGDVAMPGLSANEASGLAEFPSREQIEAYRAELDKNVRSVVEAMHAFVLAVKDQTVTALIELSPRLLMSVSKAISVTNGCSKRWSEQQCIELRKTHQQLHMCTADIVLHTDTIVSSLNKDIIQQPDMHTISKNGSSTSMSSLLDGIDLPSNSIPIEYLQSLSLALSQLLPPLKSLTSIAIMAFDDMDNKADEFEMEAHMIKGILKVYAGDVRNTPQQFVHVIVSTNSISLDVTRAALVAFGKHAVPVSFALVAVDKRGVERKLDYTDHPLLISWNWYTEAAFPRLVLRHASVIPRLSRCASFSGLATGCCLIDSTDDRRIPAGTRLRAISSAPRLDSASTFRRNADAFGPETDAVLSGVVEKNLKVPEMARSKEHPGIIFSNVEPHSGGLRHVLGGHLDALIRYLTAEISDQLFIKTFLMTYRSFTTPEILLEKLIGRHLMPDRFTGDEARFLTYKRTTKLRVCMVLKKFITDHWEDFSSPLVKRLDEFIYLLMEEGQVKLVRQLRTILSKKRNSSSDAKHNISTASCSVPEPLLPMNICDVDVMLTDIPPEEIARQISLIDSKSFRKIRPSELLNWNKKPTVEEAPNIFRIVDRFNTLSLWTATVILSYCTIKLRVRAMSIFIELAHHLKLQHNFNSLMAILSGLNQACISRLKYTIADLDRQHTKMLQDATNLMSFSSSYKNYREQLHVIQPPCVPYLGMYLGDLTFIDDGNPDKLVGGEINFAKRQTANKVIEEIMQYQQDGYIFLHIPEVWRLLSPFKHLSEKELYTLSLEFEPRGAGRVDIK